MRRDNCFDFLRFIFAFNVVLGHLTVIAAYDEFAPFQRWFDTGLSVTGFFVISGFLILQSYERSVSLKDYFIKRAKRLLPAYWFVILACAFGLVAFSTLPAREYFCSPDWWQYVGANLCFMNFLHPGLPGVFDSPYIHCIAVNPALWTLKIEVGFYLIVPLLMLWFRKSRRPWVALLIIYVLSLAYHNLIPNAVLARQLPGFMTYFAAGMAGYLYKDQLLRYKNRLILPALVIFGIEYYFGVEILTPLTWGIIVLWAAYSLAAMNNFAKYGDISYGIYIYHGPLVQILLSLGLFTTLGLPLASMLYITCVVLAGLASWHLLENRFLKRK